MDIKNVWRDYCEYRAHETVNIDLKPKYRNITETRDFLEPRPHNLVIK